MVCNLHHQKPQRLAFHGRCAKPRIGKLVRQHATRETIGTLLTPIAALLLPVPGEKSPVVDENEHQP